MKSFPERIAWYRAEQYLLRYNPYVIAVAGTYGRTMALDAIRHAIQSHRHVRASVIARHTIDIPEGILGAKGHKEHRGILHMLVQSKMREITQFEPDTIVCDIPLFTPHAAPDALSRILPRMLVLTHVGLERVDLFVNKDMIAHEYLVLANTLQADGVVILNADDKELRGIQENIQRPVITYGVHPSADVRVARATRNEGGKGLFLEVVVHAVHYEVFLPHLFAKQHVSAIAAGIAAAHGMGIPVKDAIQGLGQISPQEGLLSRTQGVHNCLVIDDSNDTCPEQLESSLKTVATLTCSGRKIIVLGDMEGLGSYAIETHEEAGRQASAIAPIIVFVGDHMRRAQEAVLKSGNRIDTHHFWTSADAAKWVSEHVRENDVVFVSGGNHMEMKKIVKALQ